MNKDNKILCKTAFANQTHNTLSAFDEIRRTLPEKVQLCIDKSDASLVERLCEIRLRQNAVSTATIDGKTMFLTENGIAHSSENAIAISEKDIDEFIYRICQGSVYAHEASLKNGYITVHGARIGICGEAIPQNGDTVGFSKIYGLNIRIPRHINGCSDELMKYIESNGLSALSGILIASRPGDGKTTLLRDLAIKLSSSKAKRTYRVAVVDERCEIYAPSLFRNCCADVYSGISKGDGLEYAVRVMSPEVIICDEIGSERDSRIIRSAHIGGIAFIASVHAKSIDNVFATPSIKMLIDDGIFSAVYFLERINGKSFGKLYNADGRAI